MNLNFVTSGAGDIPQTQVSEAIELNVLTGFDLSVTSINIDSSVAPSNVDLSTIECSAFKDDAGVIPASNPFALAQAALISTNLVEIGSVLCYVTEASS